MNETQVSTRGATALRDAAMVARELLVENLAAFGPCDHEVGICNCDIQRGIDGLDAALSPPPVPTEPTGPHALRASLVDEIDRTLATKASRGRDDAIAQAVKQCIHFGVDGVNKPPEGHWLTEMWEFGRSLASQPAPQSAPAPWISVEERVAPMGEVVLVYVPDNKHLKFALDEWTEYREDPTGMGGPTISVGEGWGDHEFEEVSHWMPLPAPPVDSSGSA